MKVIFNKTLLLVKENIYGQMDHPMKEKFIKVSDMAMEFLKQRITKFNIKDNVNIKI